jgi:hypothetical protein
MKTRHAVLLTIVLFLLGSFIRLDVAGRVVPVICFVVVGTAVWVAVDSAKLQLRDYRSPISYGPVFLFFGVLLLWAVAFPWYLSVRHQIQTGAAVLKNGATNGVA